jgi:hypothetical protein
MTKGGARVEAITLNLYLNAAFSQHPKLQFFQKIGGKRY